MMNSLMCLISEWECQALLGYSRRSQSMYIDIYEHINATNLPPSGWDLRLSCEVASSWLLRVFNYLIQMYL
jgi:hypothetical protein